jgi:hypothetical protein
VLVVHAGNRIDRPARRVARFPRSQVPLVRARLALLLDTLAPVAVVSAPAAGADLIVLGEAQRLGVAVHILLPIPEDEFVAASVADSGPEWVTMFEDVIGAASADPSSSIEAIDMRDVPQWYVAANGVLLDLARRIARRDVGDDEPVLALTVRPVGTEDPPSATDDLAARARRAGLAVLTLDPRPGACDVVA